MALAHYISAQHPQGQAISTSTHQVTKRRRLQKETPGFNFDTRFYSCRVGNPHVEVQSCLEADDDNLTGGGACKDQTQPRVRALPITQPSNFSEDSISIYSVNSSLNNMETSIQHRRRSKTPVFFVGQLERNSVICALDQAQALAEEYQAVLPLQLKTSVEPFLQKRPKKLRKIKCQLSLRELMKQQSQCSPPTPGSDAETLVGSPTWPQSPLEGNFDKQIHELHDSDDEQTLSGSDPHNDVGLKICTELLTNELATALLRHHSTENRDRASGLQILLMIEAYETVQQQIRKMLYDAKVTGRNLDHVRKAEGILEHWLQALYAVYDRSQEEEEKRNRLDYEWPVRSLLRPTSSLRSES